MPAARKLTAWVAAGYMQQRAAHRLTQLVAAAVAAARRLTTPVPPLHPVPPLRASPTMLSSSQHSNSKCARKTDQEPRSSQQVKPPVPLPPQLVAAAAGHMP